MGEREKRGYIDKCRRSSTKSLNRKKKKKRDKRGSSKRK